MATASTIIVEAIDAAILVPVMDKIGSYSVGGQTFTYQTPPELHKTCDFSARLKCRSGSWKGELMTGFSMTTCFTTRFLPLRLRSPVKLDGLPADYSLVTHVSEPATLAQ